MAGGRCNIQNHPNAGTNGFDKNPQNINRKGFPKKAYNSFIESHKKTTDMVSKKSIVDVISVIFNMTESELIEAAKDKDLPFTIRAVIQALLDPTSRKKTIADWRDWTFGRAEQKVEVEANIFSDTLKVMYSDD